MSDPLQAARQHYGRGEFGAAARLCRDLLGRTPEAAEALRLLGQCQRQQGELAAAIASFETLCRLAPEDVTARFQLGQARQQARRLPEAIAAFEAALALDPAHGPSHRNLALAQQQSGDAEAALRHYERALALLAPDPELWLQLGRLQRQSGRPDAAAASLQRALALKPDLAAAHEEQGILQLERNEPRQAVSCFERALALAPDRPGLRARLGHAWHLSGDSLQAEACFEAERARHPGDLVAGLGLADIRQQTGDFAAAEAIYAALLQAHPYQIETIARKGGCLERQGKPAAGYALLRPLVEQGVQNATLGDFYATICLRLKHHHEAIAYLEALLAAQPRLPARLRWPLHFRLGELYDALKQPERAFQAFHSGNQLKPHSFDLAAHQATLARYRESFTPALMRQLGQPARAGAGPRPVFIVGMPRSGTSLVEQILSAHPQAFGAGEQPWLGEIWHAMMQALGPAWSEGLLSLSPEAWQAYADSYRARLTAAAPPTALCVSDKLPANFLQLGLIQLLFPDAVVIHCLRDPLDTCLSCYMQDFNRLPYTSDLEQLGWYYRGYRELMAHWRHTLSLPMLELAYEELVADPETLSRRLISHVGLDWDPRCLEFYRSGRAVATASYDQVRRPIYASSVGRAQAYAPWLGPLKRILDLPAGPAAV